MDDAQAAARARRLAVLAEAAIVQVEATRRAVADLLAAVGDATSEPAAEDAPEPAPAPVVPLQPPPAPRAPAAEPDLESARLMAIEMAVAGRSREEVGAQVRAAFAIADVDALLDDVFGPAGLRRSAPDA